MAYVRPTTYTVYPDCYDCLPETQRHLWILLVVDLGQDKYAVRYLSPKSEQSLDRGGQWVTGGGKTATRHSFEKALSLAKHAVETLPLQGLTAAEAAARHQARS